LNPPFQENRSRNFYLIAHGCNNKQKVNNAFRQKVNGIECDLWADGKRKWWISHGGFMKTDLIEWLTHIKKAEQKFRRQMSIIIFDVKTPKPFTGVREIINNHLPPDLSRIYTTATICKAHIFSEIVPWLKPNEGIAIDEEDDPKKVATFFNSIGAKQCWYANGITFIPMNEKFHVSLKEAATIRDSTGPFSKIYTWSVHRKEALRKYIEEDKVDAVVVGLNNILTRPVSHALKIISANSEIQFAGRNSPLF
jgi:hypothetical protein